MAMADVAKNGVSAAVPISAVAERQKLSISYLEQIFLQLRRAGLVESERGRSGGYRLKRPSREITVAEIMRAVDEGTRMTRCSEGVPGGCVGNQTCITHELWHSLSAHIESFLTGVSLEEVVNGIPPEKRVARPAAGRVLAAE